MAIQLKVPYRDYKDLRNAADRFLKEYYPDGNIPVPIEKIVDNDFGVNVVPIPGLLECLDTDAFLSSDLVDIYIDEFVYKSRPKRYRFSLAHEIAHVILHEDCYKLLRVNSIDDWKARVSEFPPKEYGWMEWQANCLAGLILVPANPLRRSFEQAKAAIASVGLKLTSAKDAARDAAFGYIAREFDVSSSVIEKRVDYDQLG
jgi:hypothetical protein